MGIQTPAFSPQRPLEKAAPCLLAKGASSHCSLELRAPTQLCWKVAASPDGRGRGDTCCLQAGGGPESRGGAQGLLQHPQSQPWGGAMGEGCGPAWTSAFLKPCRQFDAAGAGPQLHVGLSLCFGFLVFVGRGISKS